MDAGDSREAHRALLLAVVVFLAALLIGSSGISLSRALAALAGRGDEALAASRAAIRMFEDLARNLAIPHALGMTTVLVVPAGTREVFRESWELEGPGEAHVDHVTDDLAGFLEGIAARPSA